MHLLKFKEGSDRGVLYQECCVPLLLNLRLSKLEIVLKAGLFHTQVKKVKLSAYADDIIFLIKDHNEIMVLKKIIDDFGLFFWPK